MDLAGSESTKTETDSLRSKEAKNINSDLLELGNLIRKRLATEMVCEVTLWVSKMGV